MTLHKVKEVIINDILTRKVLPYEREFDLLVKIEEINTDSKSQTEMITLRVTDNSNLLFDISVPAFLLPTNCGVDSVIRINKLKQLKDKENSTDRQLYS